MLDDYTVALGGILVILATLIVQALVASMTKAKQPGAVPGKMEASLGHESFVFRAQRTWMNSLENMSAMLGTSFLAILVGANVFWTGVLVWVMAISRILHMLLYYQISTDKNPSPRTWFFLLGVLANVTLLVFAGRALL